MIIYQKLIAQNSVKAMFFIKHLNLLMYISEWKYQLEFGARISNIKWISKNMYYENYHDDLDKLKNFDNIHEYLEINSNLEKVIDFVLRTCKKHDYKYTTINHLCWCTYPHVSLENGLEIEFDKVSKEYITLYNYKKTIEV